MHYDLCLPWYWEYDIDFVHMIEHACYENGLTCWQITPENLLESITALYKGEKSFRAILDRSQYDTRFEPIHRWSREHAVQRINPAEVSKWSEDKATMHLELITAGIHTPYTILLPPFVEQPVIPTSILLPSDITLSSSLPTKVGAKASSLAPFPWSKFCVPVWNSPSKNT